MLSTQVLQETFSFLYSSNLDIRSFAGSSWGISFSYTFSYILIYPQEGICHPTFFRFGLGASLYGSKTRIQLTSLSSHCWSIPYILSCREPLPEFSSKPTVPRPFLPKAGCYSQVLRKSCLVALDALRLRSQLVSLCCPRFLFSLPNEDSRLPVAVVYFSSWFYSLFLQTHFQIWDAHCNNFKSFHHCSQLFILPEIWNTTIFC